MLYAKRILWISNDCVGFSDVSEYAITCHNKRHNTNSRTVIQITKKWTYALQCVYSHTHMWRSHGLGSLGKAEQGEVTCPIWQHTGEKSKLVRLSFFFQRQSRIASARFTPNAISFYLGTIGRLRELINVRKPHWKFSKLITGYRQ